LEFRQKQGTNGFSRWSSDKNKEPTDLPVGVEFSK